MAVQGLVFQFHQVRLRVTCLVAQIVGHEVLSIPPGAIKGSTPTCKACSRTSFQFHQVRLRADWLVLATEPEYRFQFHQVRLRDVSVGWEVAAFHYFQFHQVRLRAACGRESV